MNKQPRVKHVTFDFGKATTIDNFKVNAVTGEVIFSNKGEIIDYKSVKLNVGYERPKNTKILSQFPITDKFALNPNHLIGKFNKLFAIDTNTQLVRNTTVSVTSIVLGETKPTDYGLTGFFVPVSAIALWNVKEKQENLAWAMAIYGWQQTTEYNKELKIGIFADSDLGNFEKYNSRELPIYEDLYLPENMEIIYASADAGKEYVGNIMLQAADKEATKFLNLLETENELQDAVAVEGKPYTHIKWWDRETVQAQFESDIKD